MQWVRPLLVAQVRFVEWTADHHLRHAAFLGLRTDKEEIPSYTPGNPGIKFNFSDKLSPRAGFAYDLFADGKWKAYGSWGLFYDTSKLEMARGLFGSEHSVTYYYTLDTYNWPAIQCDHPPVDGPNCPGTYIEQVDLRHPANSTDNFLIDTSANLPGPGAVSLPGQFLLTEVVVDKKDPTAVAKEFLTKNGLG